MKKLIPQHLKNIYHLFQAILANLIFGFPSRHIKVIGVTGTNGKTTTCQMIAKILEGAGHKVALASTINFRICGEEKVNKTKFTTLSAFLVQKFVKNAVRAGCKYVILEISSHSLDQNRVWGVDFYAGVITNITREHLDYHRTMEKYREAKEKLFKKVKVSAINLDLNNPESFLNERMEKAYGYTTMENPTAIKTMIVKAEDIRLKATGSQFRVDRIDFKLNLLGKFNVENALAAICVGIAEGINLIRIAQALEKIKLVPGRMEYVPNEKNLNIIVDYALTPDSLKKIYGLIEEFGSARDSKIIAVFGACGERDRGKRPMMGEIVDKNTDYIIITNEDPYNEDPWQIINEVAAGVKNKKEGENFWKIMDRREAIKKALQVAKSGDYVVITGKGAEENMQIGNKKIPWNDKRVIKEELENIDK